MSIQSVEINKIASDGSGYVRVELQGGAVVIADNTFNQLAIDAAFERRAKVVLELDGDRIHRVQSEPAPALPDNTPVSPDAVFITRISTQVDGKTGEMIAEVFFTKKLPPSTSEEQARTKDPVLHLLCHGAYVAAHPVSLTLDQNVIQAVRKELIA